MSRATSRLQVHRRDRTASRQPRQGLTHRAGERVPKRRRHSDAELGGGGREVARPGPHGQPGPLHAHRQPPVAAVELRVGRDVAEQVVGADVGEQARQRLVDVGVQHHRAVGLGGQHAQAVLPPAQDLRVGSRAGRTVRADRRVERHQAARIDRIEADVGAIGALGQPVELHLQVSQCQQRSLALARLQAASIRIGRPHREATVRAGVDRLRPPRHDRAAAGRGQRPGQPLVGGRQCPAFAQQQHEAALLALPFQLVEQVVERVEGLLLAPPVDQRLGDAGGAVDVRIAHLQIVLTRVGGRGAAALAPRPVGGEHLRHRRGARRVGDVAGRHLGRHHAHQIVLADHPFEQLGHRRLRPIGAIHLHVQRVEKQDEQARVGLAPRAPGTRPRCWARRAPSPAPRRGPAPVRSWSPAAARCPPGPRSRRR